MLPVLPDLSSGVPHTSAGQAPQQFLGLTLPGCPGALVALPAMLPRSPPPGVKPSQCPLRGQSSHEADRSHPPHRLDTSETHTQAWLRNTSPQTLILRMKAEATHLPGLGTAPSAPPLALSPRLTCGPQRAWSYPDPRIPGPGVAIFRLHAHH